MNFQKVRPCLFCGEEKEIKAKGYCAACYARYRKRGTPEYVKVKKPCSVEGCSNFSEAHGLCRTHLMRLYRHGNHKQTRPNGWGSKSKHPLYHSWSWHKKKAYSGICEKWKNDFWSFVEDIGDRPSKNHRLEKINQNKPISQNNFKWVELERWSLDIEEKRKKHRDYQRNYRQSIHGKRKLKNTQLNKQFGITLDEYDAMLKKQNFVCAICGEKETAINSKTKKTVDLSVDHCHETGKIRGLLCSKCNTGLGLFKDSKDLLQKAIDYL